MVNQCLGRASLAACAWPPVLLPWLTKVAFVGVLCDLNVWLGLTLVTLLLSSQGRRRHGFGMCVQCCASSPQRTRRFTRGRFHCNYLQRMMRVAGWMSQGNVDGRLAQLVDLFNTEVLDVHGDGRQLQYTQTMMPVPGKVLCKCVHSADHAAYDLLKTRVRWANGTQVAWSDASVFVTFLQGTFIWPHVGCGRCRA